MSTVLPCIVRPKAMRSRTFYGGKGVFYRNPGAELLSGDCPLLQELPHRKHVMDEKMVSRFADKY